MFNADSIETLKLKPVTKTHPKKFVKSDSFSKLSIGTTGENITRDGELLVASFIISSQDGIDAVESGMNQLSPAYSCEVLNQSGITPDGERYDAIQINRRYNHLALVPKARGGDMLSFKMDSCDEDYGIEIETKPMECIMPTIRVDGVDHAIENPVIVSHIASLTVKAEKADALEAEITGYKTAQVELTAKLDAKDSEIEVLKASKLPESEIAKRVDARVELLSSAKSVLGEELKSDATDAEIMEAVVLAVSPDAKEKIDACDEATKSIYLKARFDSAMELVAKEPIANQRKEMRKDSKNVPEKIDPRQARQDALESRYAEGDK